MVRGNKSTRTPAKPAQNWVMFLAISLFTALLIVQLQSVNFAHSITEAGLVTTVDSPSVHVAAETGTITVAKPPPRKTQAIACQRAVPPQLHKSQWQEDQHLLTWFNNVCNGTYIEMGGLDGVKFSNSHVFNKALDWKGVHVEADPRNYKNLVKNRPNEIANVHAGVCLEDRDLHWVHVPHDAAVCGFLEFAAEDFKKKHWRPFMIKRAKVVKCRRFENILHEVVGDSFHFDFFSLDIEGAELLALQSLDFDEFQFGMILVEADGTNERKDESIKAILDRAGYRFIDTINRSNWFVNRNFDLIYEDVVY
uniref:Methyltransferase FkbM domain-containing protein n=1 Tax=Craspedostauros australis TaxID=1486917 RepID=A0A7R9WWS3_9STRA|mmetsp:Transcript_22381/g.62438  ORF Transcript_22381/g.62438 Transcript_22381/m.62438 type:complete len:309 (+) Transcript_22381:197-1123(+)